MNKAIIDNFSLSMNDDTLMVPKDWNQACFDALIYKSKSTLQVLQVTNSKQHKFVLKALIPYLIALKCWKVQLTFICRKDNIYQFNIKSNDLENLTEICEILTKNAPMDNSSPSFITNWICFDDLSLFMNRDVNLSFTIEETKRGGYNNDWYLPNEPLI